MFTWTLALVLAAFHASQCASADVFLSTARPAAEPPVELAMLAQIEVALGVEVRQRTESVLGAMIGSMQATVVSMPKSPEGAISASSARYVLHRLFVQRHGWVLKGIAPDGGSWSPSSPVLGLGGYLPKAAAEFFEARFGGRESFAPGEVALLAATIDALMRGEALDRLNATYAVSGMDVQARLSREDASRVISMYLQLILLGLDATQLSKQEVEEATKDFAYMFPYWEQVIALVPAAQREVAPGLTTFGFSDLAAIVWRTSETMATRLEETNCQEMKGHLLAAEEGNRTGRVRLRDFYTSSIHGDAWQFQESIDYLRQMGVLDETDSSLPRVIVANYLYMHADCIEASSLYHLCCVSPCEDTMGLLESKIAGPDATPEQIINVLSAVPMSSSSTSSSNRTFSPALTRKLGEVASHHGGLVPLHGRLFGQWMHFAYPHECPYPHVAGTTKLMKDAEWSSATGMETSWSVSEMKKFVDASPVAPAVEASSACDSEDPDEGSCPMAAMWVHEEEHVDPAGWNATLVAKGLLEQPDARSRKSFVRSIMAVAVFLSCIASMRTLIGHGLSSLGVVPGDKKTDGDQVQTNVLSV